MACASDVRASGEVFALSLEQGFLRSTDGGRSFAPVPEALLGYCPSNLRLSPDFASDGTLWVATLPGGIRVSRDRGRTFAPLRPMGSPVDTVFDLALSPAFARDRTVAACTHEGIVLSTDGGATWTLATREALYDDHRDPWLLRGSGWESVGRRESFVFGEHRSNRAGGPPEPPFVGSRVAVFGSRGPDHGRLRVYLDGLQVPEADAWAASFEVAATQFESAELEPAFRSLEVEVSGEANPASGGTWVAVDAARVRFESEHAGALPVRARPEALTLGPDVSYGRDVRGSPRSGAPGPGQPFRAEGSVLCLALIGLAVLAALALVVRQRRARRS